MFNNTKVKTTTIYVQQYRRENKNNVYSMMQK